MRSEIVILATGCSGHGVMHAPALGPLVAEQILDGQTSLDIAMPLAGAFRGGDVQRSPASIGSCR